MKIYVVGLGPGNFSQITPAAQEALKAADVVVGYTTYINLIQDLLGDKEVVATGMRSEIERCEQAVELAKQGKQVAVVSSGDAGIYGMATLLYELLAEETEIDLEVIPGITAANAAAAVLGAPLANDFAVISLSDLMTPWEVIEKRLEGAAQADFVICLYNPMSKTRRDYLAKACEIALKYKSADTICGVVRNALRPGQSDQIMSLAELKDSEVDMFTMVIIGNAATHLMKGRMVTKRGYQV
ncbi:MAG: precorrin-3B C(17)-methyltransferase [Clostridium sp.]|nr:precorrin-3B C(17)-methyltransferase [Clostridium sp.]